MVAGKVRLFSFKHVINMTNKNVINFPCQGHTVRKIFCIDECGLVSISNRIF